MYVFETECALPFNLCIFSDNLYSTYLERFSLANVMHL